MTRVKKCVTILKAHDEWLKEHGISLSRFIQNKISEVMKKEMLEREHLPEY